MSGKLTTSMCAMAVTAMLREAVGLSLIESFELWDEWLAERDRRAAERAYDEGFIAGWSDGWDDTDTRDDHPNPYRKENK